MVRVKFFANFREIAGKREMELSAKTLNDLIKSLLSEHPEFEKLMGYAVVMINGRIVKKDDDVNLEDCDVVAIFPPVSGG